MLKQLTLGDRFQLGLGTERGMYGLATEVGILPTAWHAVNLGFFVVVPRDCVGSMVKEHHAEAIFARQGNGPLHDFFLSRAARESRHEGVRREK